MNRLITSTLVVAMLSVGALNSFAVQNQQGQQVAATAATTITGQIIKIKNHNLTVKDQSGKYHVVSFKDSSMIQGLKSGDQVTVAYLNGKASSIQKVEGSTSSSSSNKPM